MTPRFRDPSDPVRSHIEQRRPALVVGLGRSGASVARLLSGLGCPVEVSEAMSPSQIPALPSGLPPGLVIHWGGHPSELFRRFDLVVVSPGVPTDTPALAAARESGARVIGEMELAFRMSTMPWVAVTGTNGKSTTTTLLEHLARQSGVSAAVGGNLGTPACDLVMESPDAAWLVAEVSSFQLETIETFRPSIALLLNVTPDHLDRYPDEASYVAAKGRVFQNMGPDDWAVLNAEDPIVQSLAALIPCRRLPFARNLRLDRGVMMEGGQIVLMEDGEKIHVIDARKLALAGTHNQENAMAAVGAGHLMGVGTDAMARVLATFTGLEHRMELVGYYRGVPIYNDSKGTNVGATLRSLEGLGRDVILVLGGKDKGAPYDPLRSLITEKVRLQILLGEAAARMVAELGDLTDTRVVDSLDEAVRTALDEARPGSEILFSPACSSYDMFRNYEERGRLFKDLARRYMGMKS